MRVRILIADRNRMASHLLAESLSRDPFFEVASVATADEVLSSAMANKPDVAVISAEFDGGTKTGLQIVRTLSSRQPKIEIVVFRWQREELGSGNLPLRSKRSVQSQ